MDENKTPATRTTIDHAVRKFLRDKKREDASPETVDWYRRRLGRLAGALGTEFIDEWSRDALAGFLDGLDELGRSRDYIRGFHQVLRTFIAYCREEGWSVSEDLIRENAVGSRWFAIKKPKAPETPVLSYTEDEVIQILEVADSPRTRAMVRLYLGSGLRLSELAALRVEDVDFDGKAVFVRQGKGRKPRRVYMGDATTRALRAYFYRARPETDCPYFFVAQGGRKGLTKWAISAVFTRMNKRLPFRFHAHALRHTFATDYARTVGDANRLQQLLGHKSAKMTQRYIHLAGEDLREGFDRMREY